MQKRKLDEEEPVDKPNKRIYPTNYSQFVESLNSYIHGTVEFSVLIKTAVEDVNASKTKDSNKSEPLTKAVGKYQMQERINDGLYAHRMLSMICENKKRVESGSEPG
jgi:hypothetical protein